LSAELFRRYSGLKSKKYRKKRVATWAFPQSFIVTKYLAGVNFAKRKPEPQLMGKKTNRKKKSRNLKNQRGKRGKTSGFLPSCWAAGVELIFAGIFVLFIGF